MRYANIAVNCSAIRELDTHIYLKSISCISLYTIIIAAFYILYKFFLKIIKIFLSIIRKLIYNNNGILVILCSNVCSGVNIIMEGVINMVTSYLERLHDECLSKKNQYDEKLNELQIHLKENMEFIKMLEESNDSSYEAFTPREINSKHKEKISELKEEQKAIVQELDKTKEEYDICIKKLDEITSVIKVAKSTLIQKKNEAVESDLYRLMILETQENERQRISRELHDSTVQNLTSLVHKTELCSKLIEMDPVRCKLELITMSKTLRDIINDARQMIYNLRPMSFDDIGLEVTIERTLEKLKTMAAKNISFTVVGEPYDIKPVIGITLLRIIQEACNNAIKHAEASIICVKLIYREKEVIVSIEDDGKGFDMESLDVNSRNDNSGFGLSMMKERVYLLSGNIEMTSRVNAGTKVVVTVPINNKEEN